MQPGLEMVQRNVYGPGVRLVIVVLGKIVEVMMALVAPLISDQAPMP